MLKKAVNFVLIEAVVLFSLLLGSAGADTMYGVIVPFRPVSIFHRIRAIAFLGAIISALTAIVGLLRYRFKNKDFYYRSDYGRFKPMDNVKIVCVDNDKVIRQKGRIVSIDSKKVSFLDKTGVHKCVADDVISIQKCSKFVKISVILFSIFLLLLLELSVISYAMKVAEDRCLRGDIFVVDYEK
jgi:hypothetical protein